MKVLEIGNTTDGLFQCLNGIHADSNSKLAAQVTEQELTEYAKGVSMPERHSCGF